MSNKYFQLRVKGIEKLTPDCVGVEFDVPSEIRKQFQFTQGQYLTLKKEINNEEVVRSYSLYTSPHENRWKVGIKEVPSGRFSTFANRQLKIGDTLEVMPPMGNFFTPLSAENAKIYVAFVAGSGITPIMSQIKTILVEEPLSRFILFYGNQKTESIIFREELDELKNREMGRLSIYHILSREVPSSPLFSGRLDVDKCQKFANGIFKMDEVSDFFLCGPARMIMDIKGYLIEQGVDKRNIHFELFSTDGLEDSAVSNQRKEESFDPKEQSKVRIQLDGNQFEFNLEYGGKNILDAALENGADLPFACKGGVCCTCRAKLVEGDVVMDVNYALEQDELDQGFILTCQAHPRTENIMVDFDTK